MLQGASRPSPRIPWQAKFIFKGASSLLPFEWVRQVGASLAHPNVKCLAAVVTSPHVVIYPLAPVIGCGTIYGIGLTGVTQQIVIASLVVFSVAGDFWSLQSIGWPFSVPGAVRFMLGCAACRDPLDRIERNGNTEGFAWIFEIVDKVLATWRL